MRWNYRSTQTKREYWLSMVGLAVKSFESGRNYRVSNTIFCHWCSLHVRKRKITKHSNSVTRQRHPLIITSDRRIARKQNYMELKPLAVPARYLKGNGIVRCSNRVCSKVFAWLIWKENITWCSNRISAMCRWISGLERCEIAGCSNRYSLYCQVF